MPENNSNVQHDDVVTCFHVLAALLVEDGEVADEEIAWFNTAMETMGLTQAEREAAQRIMDGAEIEARAASLPREVQLALLDSMMEGAMVDGEFDEQEKAFVFRVAAAMSIDCETARQSWLRAMRLVSSDR